MSATARRRGLSLPGLARAFLILAAICGGWWVWQEIRPVPELPSSEDNPTARLQSVEALVRDGEDSVPVLLEMLSDADSKIRRDALTGLGRFDSPPDEVREAVRARLSDDDSRVRLYALSACELLYHDEGQLGGLAVQLLADPDG